jgi:hypothetical protein
MAAHVTGNATDPYLSGNDSKEGKDAKAAKRRRTINQTKRPRGRKQNEEDDDGSPEKSRRKRKSTWSWCRYRLILALIFTGFAKPAASQ